MLTSMKGDINNNTIIVGDFIYFLIPCLFKIIALGLSVNLYSALILIEFDFLPNGISNVILVR